MISRSQRSVGPPARPGSRVSLSIKCLAILLGVVALACSDSSTAPPPPSPPPPPPPDPTTTFDIEVRYVTGTNPTPEQQQAIDEAVELWESVIVGDLPPLQVNRPAGLCERVEAPAMDEEVDDLVVWFEFGAIDGPLGTQAWGGVCELRDSYLPAVGSALFDTADFNVFGKPIVVHELAHALGFGEVWDEMGLLADASNPANGGPGFIRPSADATITSAQPDANFGTPDGSALSELLLVGGGLSAWTGGPPDEELRALFKFDLSALSFESPIADAQVIMWDSLAVGMARGILVSPILDPWGESTVTWNAQPAIDVPLEIFHLPDQGCPDSEGCFIASHLDTEALVQVWLSDQQLNNGLMLSIDFAADPDYGVAFHSRHNADVGIRPALYIQPRAHFIGPHAIAAYDAAGGAGSLYPKVPLENRYRTRGASADGHWMETLFLNEYMEAQAGSHLSTVTVGAMEDMGYEVDYSPAEMLPVTPPPDP